VRARPRPARMRSGEGMRVVCVVMLNPVDRADRGRVTRGRTDWPRARGPRSRNHDSTAKKTRYQRASIRAIRQRSCRSWNAEARAAGRHAAARAGRGLAGRDGAGDRLRATGCGARRTDRRRPPVMGLNRPGGLARGGPARGARQPANCLR
jgi:hypothetical protein